jgi:hypothetical protein
LLSSYVIAALDKIFSPESNSLHDFEAAVSFGKAKPSTELAKKWVTGNASEKQATMWSLLYGFLIE